MKTKTEKKHQAPFRAEFGRLYDASNLEVDLKTMGPHIAEALNQMDARIGESAAIVAVVGLAVVSYADEGEEVGAGTISEVGKTHIFVASDQSDPLEYVMDATGWRFPLADFGSDCRTISCAETGCPVVLPSAEAKAE